ncbi:MAG: uracil-DNA glycosylase family protein [Betaproteobacteria bacterium]|nr:uracil-DNA glycosylase family protein [Betaproteobacteria bacterium]
MGETININNYLAKTAVANGLDLTGLQLPDCELDPEKIKVVMISEAPPQNPDDGFYSTATDPDYMRTTLGLFAAAGVRAESMRDILDMGIYITTAVKTPKTGYAVDAKLIKAHLPILEAELALFPNLSVIMLMGDVAKKAVNLIVKAKTKKNVIPAESTYKIRQNEYYWGDVRVFPSYIMTGGSILIEKFKRNAIADDMRRMIKAMG